MSTAEDVEEIEANAFAAALLMPEPFLKKDLAMVVVDIDDEKQIQSLAKLYEVSDQAMTLRLANLSSRGKRRVSAPPRFLLGYFWRRSVPFCFRSPLRQTARFNKLVAEPPPLHWLPVTAQRCAALKLR